ncbi:MAG: ABC transporter ATP-binding protein [Acutalibacteraceae bacterium]|nr:ABC transporter ATP-binding protein [Acutalibacteraceae bacterium]
MKLNTIKKVLFYVKKYRLSLILSIITAALSSVLALMIPIKVGEAIDLIVGKNNVDFNGLFTILLEIVIMLAATAVLQWIMNIQNNRVVYNVIRDVRFCAFCRIQKLPLKFIDSQSDGDIVSRVITDADQFAEGLLLGFSQFFTGVVTIVCTLIFMFTINPIIALVVVVLTPLSLIIANFIAKRTYKMFKRQSEIRGEQTAFASEMIGNIKTAKAYSMEAQLEEKFDQIDEKLKNCSVTATFFSSLTNPCTRFVNAVVYAAVTLTGAIFTIGQTLTIGGLTCFLSYANQYTKPFNEISGVFTELQNALACADRLFELIEADIIEEADNTPALQNVEGEVELKNVSFSYTPDRPLIENLSLFVESGKKIAIVGPTGCGKTTLINLLMRFYDVNSGSISVDSTDICTVTRQSLRSNIGMVLQDTWIKAGTVRENIALGKPDATEDEIIAAARASHAHSFIKRLPNGYDTVLSENGGGLSQGQKQLLCICRVMLTLPPVLILDEATSSIDTRTEHRIQRAFTKMMKGRTSFIVAHRLSTVRDADLILVMRDGNIIEQGTHMQLLERGGFYKELYNSQFI